MKTVLYIAVLATLTACTSSLTACGGGGSAAQVVTPPVVPVVPVPPAITTLLPSATSYANKTLIDLDGTQLPSLRLLKEFSGWTPSAEELAAGCGPAGACVGNGVVNDRSLAFGDFFQDGTYSAFMTTWRKTGVNDAYLINKPIVDAANKMYFAQFKDGKWVDNTAKLLPNPVDRFGCVSSSYTAVADFNGDKKPDLFLSCHGIDYSFGASDTVSGKAIWELMPTTWRSVFFDEQIVLLSQPDGTYKRSVIPGKIYGHHASAADINNDGKIDVATVNASWGNTTPSEDYQPYFLIGNGDGTFTKDYTRMPRNIVSQAGSYIHIYWTYLIPIDGRIDLIAVGDKIAWYKNPGNGNFSEVVPTYIPVPVDQGLNALDMVYKNGNFYIDHSGGAWPGVMTIKKVNAQTLAVSEIYRLNRDLGMSEGAISPQLKITKDGLYLVPFVAGCERRLEDPQFNTSKCSIKIPIN